MNISGYVKEHPYSSGIIAVVGGIIFIVIVRGSGGSSNSVTSASRPSDAEVAANATIQAAQINAQAQSAVIGAQAGAAVQVASLGAGVQLNSDNKAAEVAMAQIKEQGTVYHEYIAASQATALANSQVRLAAISQANNLPKNTRYESRDVLVAAASGQPVISTTTNGSGGGGNSASEIISSVGGAVSSIGSTLGSLFSDQRLKENIRFEGYDAKGREVYSYNYKGSRTRRVGYIAQSIARSEPELVHEDMTTGYLRIPANMSAH